MRNLLTAIFFSCINLLIGQNDSVYIINLNDLEEIVENQEIEEDLDIDNTIEELSYLLSNPYNINEVSHDQLEAMNLLNEYQINSFVEYRNTVGPFISLYELQAIPNWNILTIERMLPYLDLKTTSLGISGLSDMVKGGKHLLTLRWKNIIEEREGFNNDGRSDYLGDPNHIYVRYRYNYSNKLRWGLTAEKDSGEPFFTKSNKKGFDYYSAFLYYNSNEGIIQSFNLGDYTISMGQGLILNNAFGSGKSTRTTYIKKSGKVIRPYSSVNEVNFFRGIAARLKINKDLTLTPFVSRKSVDGTLRQDTLIDDGFGTFSSLVQDGYHRTENEIAKENTIQQTNYGAVMKYVYKNLKVGVNLLNTTFDRPLKTDDQLYRLYAFSGTNLTNVSTDFSFRYKNASFFGEGARSSNNGKAFILGSQVSLHPSLDVALSYRNYGKEYQVLNPKAFGESINATNEEGLYIGVQVRLNKEITMSAYHDAWRNEWLRFRVDAPGGGNESIMRFEYYKKRKYTFYIQYKNEIKSINGVRESAVNKVIDKKTQRLRIHLSNKVSSSIELRNRIEFSHFSTPSKTSKGWLAFQDLILKPIGSNFSLTTRFSIFDTDDFDSRIYTYENDILYEFRIPFSQNQGTRFYINTRYKASRKLSLEFRYARTHYNNRDEIGSSSTLR